MLLLLFADETQLPAGTSAAFWIGVSTVVGAVVGAISTAVINWAKAHHDMDKDSKVTTIDQYERIVKGYEVRLEKVEAKCEAQGKYIVELQRAEVELRRMEMECQGENELLRRAISKLEGKMKRHNIWSDSDDYTNSPTTPVPKGPGK